MTAPRCILTIAGSDSSSGAGVQADLKAIAALGGYGLNTVTSVVSEVPGKVSRLALLEPALIADQIRVLCEAFPIRAAKTGMLGGREQVEAVVAQWQASARGVPLIVDPVMVATSGRRLLAEDAIQAVVQQLLPLATLVTPNLDEAAVLWDRPVTTREAMECCARELHERHGCAVLVKGGHLQGAAADVLWYDDQATWFETERVPGVRTHGTGCTYSASIATGLGQGLALPDAVHRAKQFVHRAIAQHHAWGEIHALNHLLQEPA